MKKYTKGLILVLTGCFLEVFYSVFQFWDNLAFKIPSFEVSPIFLETTKIILPHLVFLTFIISGAIVLIKK